MCIRDSIYIEYFSFFSFFSNEDTDVQAIVNSWVTREAKDNKSLAGWIADYFVKALDYTLKQESFVVETTLVGAVLSGLSHMRGVTSKGEFACALMKGMGANLHHEARISLAKEVQ